MACIHYLEHSGAVSKMWKLFRCVLEQARLAIQLFIRLWLDFRIILPIPNKHGWYCIWRETLEHISRTRHVLQFAMPSKQPWIMHILCNRRSTETEFRIWLSGITQHLCMCSVYLFNQRTWRLSKFSGTCTSMIVRRFHYIWWHMVVWPWNVYRKFSVWYMFRGW